MGFPGGFTLGFTLGFAAGFAPWIFTPADSPVSDLFALEIKLPVPLVAPPAVLVGAALDAAWELNG